MVGTYIVIIQWKQRLQNNKARLFRVFLLYINTCIIRTYSENYTCKCYTTWVYNNNKKNIHDHICVREIINEHMYNMYENTGISVLQEMSLICMQDWNIVWPLSNNSFISSNKMKILYKICVMYGPTSMV